MGMDNVVMVVGAITVAVLLIGLAIFVVGGSSGATGDQINAAKGQTNTITSAVGQLAS